MRTPLHIEAMDCPTEERLVRSRLKGIDGVERLDFDLVRRELTDTHGLGDPPPLLDALAKADIGFAMGAAGTGTALETADVALMEDDLRKLPQFLRLSRRTSRVLRQNIALAIGINVVFFGLAAVGAATLRMAVSADMGASLLVTFHGLRLLTHRGSPR